MDSGRGSSRERWEQVADEPPRWDERNALIAAQIPAGSSVLDLGCGSQTLRTHLDPSCTYVPVDLIDRPGVIVCDFNAGTFPVLDTRVDVAVCSGLLEYLDEPAVLLGRLPWLARRAVLSYADLRPGQTISHREELGWVNHLTRDKMLLALQAAGLDGQPLADWGSQMVVSAESNDPAAAATAADWDDAFPRLRRFAEQFGHPLPAPHVVHDGFALGEWVATQRGLRARRSLPEVLVCRLEALDLWTWSEDEARWQRGLLALRSLAPGEAVDDGLASWLRGQRRAYESGALSPERVRALEESPGWAWNGSLWNP